MKVIVLFQLLVYLFLSPLIIFFIKEENRLFGISFVFLLGVLIGIFFHSALFRPSASKISYSAPHFSNLLKYFWIFFSFLYILIVIDQGLITRRLGSEVVASIAASMNLIDKIIMRTYEVAYYPILFVFISSILGKRLKFPDIFFLLSITCSFFFLGVLDSRMKIVFPIIFYYVFFVQPKYTLKPLSNKIYFIFAICLFIAAIFVGFGRLSHYDNTVEYLLNDLVIRLDGLQLISRIDDHVSIPFYGTQDFQMWQNIISLIPFLEVAKDLKELGLTSTKSYFLRVVLGANEFDSNDSYVTDLFYFGGYYFIFLGAVLFGFLVSRVDFLLKYSMIWKNRFILSLALAFSMNGWLFENGYTFMFFTTTRDFFILYFIFLMLNFSNNQTIKH